MVVSFFLFRFFIVLGVGALNTSGFSFGGFGALNTSFGGGMLNTSFGDLGQNNEGGGFSSLFGGETTNKDVANSSSSNKDPDGGSVFNFFKDNTKNSKSNGGFGGFNF